MADAFAFEARRYDTGEPVRVTVDAGRITRFTAAARGALDVPWVAPGLVDVQINGYGGQEFSSLELTPERVAEIVRRHFSFGVTRVCPTLTTQNHQVMRHGVATIAAACERWPDVARGVTGIHLEGPYFSVEEGPRGAHPAEHCRPPDLAEFEAWQAASGGRVRLLTMSPEFADAPQFIAQVVAGGVVVAIGHTGASGAQIRAAVDAGVAIEHAFGQRRPSDVAPASQLHLGSIGRRSSLCQPDRGWPSFAARSRANDHPREIGLSLSVGQRRVGTGGPACRAYSSSGCELEILADGRLVIAGQDQLLAGASLPIGVGVANVMRFRFARPGHGHRHGVAHSGAIAGIAIWRTAGRPPGRPDIVRSTG